MKEDPSEYVIEVNHLVRNFGKKTALDNVSVKVPKGVVFGLVGANGAGKTTLIKHLLGAMTPQEGVVRVFGMDPVTHPKEVLSRIGYLSEDRDLPGWMRVGELMRYTEAFYPAWDAEYAERLREQFALPLKGRLNRLSRGELARAGLLVALAHRPELLLLDEPSSGLDPVARRDILAAVVRSVAEEGRTVFFSSHLLDEVERVADHVVMLDQGTVHIDLPMDDLQARHHRFIVRFNESLAECPTMPGILLAEGEGKEWALVCEGDETALAASITGNGGVIMEHTAPSLDAIFVARAGGNRSAA